MGIPLLFVYHIAFFVVTITIFEITIRHSLPSVADDPQVNMFETIKMRDKDGNERKWVSALLSALVLIALFSTMLFIFWLVITYLSDLGKIIFAIVSLSMMFSFFTRIPLPSLLSSLKKFPLVEWIIRGILILVFGLGWVISPSWVLYDVQGLIAVYTLVSTIPAIRLRFLVIGLIALIGFDIWGVFITGMTEKIATNVSFIPPAVVILPEHPWEWLSNPVFILGIGDLFFSGIVIKGMNQYGLRYWAVAGYVIGLTLSSLLSGYLQRGVPALMTLVPCLLLASLLGYGFNKLRLRTQVVPNLVS